MTLGYSIIIKYPYLIILIWQDNLIFFPFCVTSHDRTVLIVLQKKWSYVLTRVMDTSLMRYFLILLRFFIRFHTFINIAYRVDIICAVEIMPICLNLIIEGVLSQYCLLVKSNALSFILENWMNLHTGSLVYESRIIHELYKWLCIL